MSNGGRQKATSGFLCSPELTHATTKDKIVTDPRYAAFTALDPFFDIAQQGLVGLVDGDHYFDTIADDVEFEFRFISPDGPRQFVVGDALMALSDRIGWKMQELTLPASVCSLLHAPKSVM